MASAANSKLNTKNSALVLFAHGARDAQWSEPMRAIQRAVAGRRSDLTVELAFLEIMKPTLGEAVADLARIGHTTVTIAPLFLAPGGHLKRDLARLVADLRARHPASEINVLPAIGEVDELVRAISEWLVNCAPRRQTLSLP